MTSATYRTRARRPSLWRASVDDLVSDITDYDRVGVCGFGFTRLPVGQLLALRGRRGLTYVGWGGGIALEILLDANAVAAAELTFSSFDIYGLAARFRQAIETDELTLREWTALGMIKALQARSQRIDFEVMRPLAGTDLGTDWSDDLTHEVGDGEMRQAAVPALALDVFLLHASRADDAGNVEIAGARGIDLTAMFAADRVLVSVEERVRVGELREPHSFVLPKTFVSGIAVAEFGAYPTSCLPHYPADLRRIGEVSQHPRDNLMPGDLFIANPATRRRLEATARLDHKSLLEVVERKPSAQGHGAPAVERAASRDEIMICALAHTIGDTSIATIGSASPLPSVAYLLAKLLWAPDLPILSFNGGLVDIGWRPMSLSYAELLDYQTAATHAGGDETYHWYYQQGRITHEVVGTAQIDRSGATNTVAVRRSDGSFVRLPGQGGMADVANLHANFMVYLPRQGTRNTVTEVDVHSACRTWHDPDERRRLGLSPGRMAVLTDLGQFEYHAEREALVLTHVHPGVELGEVRAKTGWELLLADDLQTTQLPTDDELHALRRHVDPLGIRRLDFVPSAERQQLINEILDREDSALDRIFAARPTTSLLTNVETPPVPDANSDASTNPANVNDPTRSSNSTDAPGPLGHVRVLDFTQLLQGPMATQILADLGADVIKFEKPDGEWMRHWGIAASTTHGEMDSFLAFNRNKRSVAVDLKDPDSVARILDLAADADVVVENFRPGVMSRLGLGYEQFRQRNPRIVYASSSGYGQTGPYSGRPGQDLLVQALSGALGLTGKADDPPTPCGIGISDEFTSLHLVVGILAALSHRDATGVGQQIAVDLFSCTVAAQQQELTVFLNHGETLERPRTNIG